MPKQAPRLSLKAEYHDGQVESIELGPRREVTLTVRLDPVWNDGDGTSRRLHFSAIQNFEEVRAFFASVKGGNDDRAIDEVECIVKPSNGIVGIGFARLGYLELCGAKFREL